MNQPIVFLTGASAGIGKATAELLMHKGAVVYGASRRGFEGQKSVESGGQIISVKLDVNNEEEVKHTVDQIVNQWGRIDTVICNAGNGISGSIEDSSIEEIRYQFETNYFGVIKTIQACLPHFRKQGHGKIITLSSVAGIVPIPYQAFYSSVKSALLILMQALSLEVKPFGIQCCSILPGDTKTEFTSARKYTNASQIPDSPYYKKMKASVGKMEKDEQNGMSPNIIAQNIVKQTYKQKMKAIVIPGFQYQLICWLFNRLPAKFRLWVVGLLY